MKIAIVVDWLVVYAGAERVIEQMIACYPQADVFAVVDFLPQDQRAFLQGKTVTTTFIQKLPLAKRYYRHYLPLMTIAIEQLDLSAYDVILSSSHAVAKGVITGPDQLHVSYIHSPMRYAWDLQAQYLQESNLTRGLKSWLTRYLLHRLRLWDFASSARVDHYLCNSNYIVRRIEKIYRRSATVIYPPVNIDTTITTEALSLRERGRGEGESKRFTPPHPPVGTFSRGEKGFSRYCQHETDNVKFLLKKEFYITASRLVPYKKMPLIAEAFKAMPDKHLIMIGDGPELDRVKAVQAGNVEILGYQSTASLRQYLSEAKALVFAGVEDFGIILVEALACGTPVIAFDRGGALEIVQDKLTGILYSEQTVPAIIDAIRQFEQSSISKEACQESVQKFSIERFKQQLREFIEHAISQKFQPKSY